MDDVTGMWLEAAAGVQSEIDAELRDDAFEVFRAEAARTRLVDRRGDATILLRCGRIVRGVLQSHVGDATPDAFLALRSKEGRWLFVNPTAVVRITGSHAGLRDELASTVGLTSALRDLSSEESIVRALLSDGAWIAGPIGFVGADHCEVHTREGVTVVPYAAVDAWDPGERAT